MPSISVKVVLSDRKKLLKWQIHPVIGNPSLCEFFHSLAIGQVSPEVFINKDYHEFLLKTKVGDSVKGEFFDVNIQCKFNEIAQNFGNFFLFELQIPEDYQLPLQKEKNVFEILISNSTQLSLPSFKLSKKLNRKDLLRQDMVEWIKKNGGGWKGKIAAESIGRSFVNDLLNAIWYVDMCEKFAKCLTEYHTYLKAQNIEISKNHQLEIPVRSMKDSISIKIYDAAHYFPNFRAKYNYNKPSFIQNIPDNIHCKFGIFRYSSGNNAFHACFLWRVDENLSDEEIINKSYVICNRLKSDMPIYHTRFMRTQFKNKANLILGMPTKNHQIRTLYQELTSDSSAAGNMTEKQVMLCTKQLLVNGDDKIVVDLRNVNKGKPEQFSEFWKYVKQYLEEHAAVDDRRHGTVGGVPGIS
ncbi:unnamed protein product [Rhizophagus irregularis]|nr:unnamed protein product [Rhizophagus irregularis]